MTYENESKPNWFKKIFSKHKHSYEYLLMDAGGYRVLHAKCVTCGYEYAKEVRK